MLKSSRLTIDLKTVKENLQALTETNEVMVMVKGNAYGTDPVFLSKFIQNYQLPKIPFLGVSHISEAVHLKKEGIQHPIFVISSPPELAHVIAEHQFSCAVSSFKETVALNEAAKKAKNSISVHLFLNTGMNRFGIREEEALTLYKWIEQASHLTLDGVMTHFAAAEIPSFDSFSYSQINRFKKFIDSLPKRPKWIHAANSAAATRFSLPFCNLNRIGLATMGYGYCPNHAKPALTLTTSISFLNNCKQGESVGYNRTFFMKSEEGRIGVIPLGYYDGLPRSIAGKGYVLIRGQKAPMIGSICMDFTLIDLTDVSEAQIGDEVVVFNEELTPMNIADWSETDVREILVRLNPRVERIWKHPKLRFLSEKRQSKRVSSPILTL